jgi:hypothetical protein
MCMSLFISPRPEISIHSDFVFSWRQTVHFTFHPDSVKRSPLSLPMLASLLDHPQQSANSDAKQLWPCEG